MLHTITKSPAIADLKTFYIMVKKNDAIVLLQDGVLYGLKNTYALQKLMSISIFLYALKVDVLARGLSNKFSVNIVLIEYKHFVNLSVKHQQQLSW
ncbi:Protein TusB [Candidatus Profftia lariciata]|uniref:sulfurtransferase complex subunit TusB n=1 Tax=Candidatus Profftia lariciata TaxID=1987921 RepID=UPI001D017698|nr:sulfurtransferase complex subunit TusB [Candidatus Profftia lariciata]UDG81578.1 Protein TusB [Candidatus Profftia lariciata]